MNCREHCAHWRVCENITNPYMKNVVNGDTVEVDCSAFLPLQKECTKGLHLGNMYYCSNCGKLTYMHNYCASCGAKVTEAKE